MTGQLTATVVGGGIAGLASAVSLAQAGWRSQGVATALEDGVCVGRMIAAPVTAGRELAPALAAFDQARRPRCRAIPRQSVMVAGLGADLRGGWRQPVRNRLMHLIPVATALRAGAPIAGWTPPS